MKLLNVASIIYFGQTAIVMCDRQCQKAWGTHSRPQIQLSDDPDDTVSLADDELGEAPIDPGTYEGGHAKPHSPDEFPNKWCVRECERCYITSPGAKTIELYDHSQRIYNLRWREEGREAPPGDGGER